MTKLTGFRPMPHLDPWIACPLCLKLDYDPTVRKTKFSALKLEGPLISWFKEASVVLRMHLLQTMRFFRDVF